MAAVRQCEPKARIVVTDDGLPFDLVSAWLRHGGGPDIMKLGLKPFVFARNVNLGLQMAGWDDVVVINDDALLQTSGGFSLLQKTANEHQQYGIISATTNITGNPAQQPHGIGLREERNSIAFIAVLIPRRTIESVGLMDERFGGLTPEGKPIYGYCDNDYCRRVRNAGLKVGIHDGCFVDHGSLRSTFRGDPRAAGDTAAAREIYLQKWGNLD
jgi:hypothetical protein